MRVILLPKQLIIDSYIVSSITYYFYIFYYYICTKLGYGLLKCHGRLSKYPRIRVGSLFTRGGFRPSEEEMIADWELSNRIVTVVS